MKIIWLTKGQFTIVDDEDYEKLKQHKWHVHKTKNSWYAVRRGRRPLGSKNQPAIYMHREILGLTDSSVLVDHENGNGLLNQKYNLRTANYCQNRANAKCRKNNSSKHKGLWFDKRNGNWMAKIQKGRPIYLGVFKNEMDAALAYNKKAIELFGEFANLNEIAV